MRNAGSEGKVEVAPPALDDLNKAVETLADALDRLGFRDQLADTAPFGFTYRNLESGAEHSNAAFERIVGRSYSECRQLGWTQIIHPEDLERYRDQSEQIRSLGHPAQAIFRVLHPDGRVR